MSYKEVRDDLKNLLDEFGPPRAKHSPGYPFLRLSNDRLPQSETAIWQIEGRENLNTKKDWSDRELIGNETKGGFAVEVAHIKWHQAGGPDYEQNGIALCSLHHKLFDRGVFTLNDKLVFLVAENAHGTYGMDEWLVRYHGQEVRKPQRPDYYPGNNYLSWHVKEVFRGPARC